VSLWAVGRCCGVCVNNRQTSFEPTRAYNSNMIGTFGGVIVGARVCVCASVFNIVCLIKINQQGRTTGAFGGVVAGAEVCVLWFVF